MYTAQAHKSGRPIKYVRHNKAFRDLVITSAVKVLRILKEGKYILDY